MRRRIGIVGMPPRDVMRRLKEEKALVYDLDALHVKPDLEITASYIPRVYCAVLRTVLTNVKRMSLDAVYIDVGEGKCNGANYLAGILESEISIPVFRVRNEDVSRLGNPVSESALPLIDKMKLITEGVMNPEKQKRKFLRCDPTAGFWGVPPRDFSILKLFPVRTHVFGWARCMENKTPSDIELESLSNPSVPTVFFAQSFCQKSALAYYLARQHPCGLYVDADVYMGHSTKAKLQAFLELNGVTP